MKVKRVPIGELFGLARRAVVPVPDEEYQEIGVRSFGKGLFIKEPLTGAELGDKRVFRVREGDFIVSNVFAWEGAVGLAGSEHDGLIGSHRFMTWVPRSDDFSVTYVLEYFRSKYGVVALGDASPGSAGRNRTLAIKNFERIEVPLPDRETQDRIAAHLDSVESQVGSWPTPGLPAAVFPKVLGALIRQHELPIVSLSDLCSVDGTTIRPGEAPDDIEWYVGLDNIEPHTGRLLGRERLGEEKGGKHISRPGQVMYNGLRPALNKVLVTPFPLLSSLKQFVLTPAPGLSPDLLGALLRSDIVLDQAVGSLKSLQMPNVNLAHFKRFSVPDLRELSDQAVLVQRAADLTSLFVALKSKTSRRIHLQSAILPAARNEVFHRMVGGIDSGSS